MQKMFGFGGFGVLKLQRLQRLTSPPAVVVRRKVRGQASIPFRLGLEYSFGGVKREDWWVSCSRVRTVNSGNLIQTSSDEKNKEEDLNFLPSMGWTEIGWNSAGFSIDRSKAIPHILPLPLLFKQRHSSSSFLQCIDFFFLTCINCKSFLS